MDIKELVKNITELFAQVPDSTGLLRCVYFTDIYRMLIKLKDLVESQEETHKLEKLQLEEEIKDLKRMINERSESDGG